MSREMRIIYSNNKNIHNFQDFVNLNMKWFWQGKLLNTFVSEYDEQDFKF